ncbi:MAG: [Fe-S]-binding protein [Planctomycetaceae bacterium]|nr:[Fe-S]-binding protein [Planctomycetaceae bacterium]|tara:strand:+ start:1867 stop:3147 length:1281 start_codon:yes stop_codon:yes gene_type:complete
MAELPRVFKVRQHFQAVECEDVSAEVDAQLGKLDLGQKIKSGDTVAISAGSRGIANIHIAIRAIVQHVQSLGGEPFVVPAMGSHGGGTAEGQRAIVEGYGMTEEFLGCPIKASMETHIVCEADEGFPVHFDKHAWEADHVVVCNRIKPHTNFAGDIESGLMKMMLIGLGKHNGAKIYHRAINDYSFGQIVRSVAKEVLDKCGVVAGVALVENQFDHTALVEAVAPENFESREKELLVLAKQYMPSIPFDEVQFLAIDEMGKDISGSGMDTNVIGRKYDDHRATEGETPKVKYIAMRGLTPATHGNATGLGMAEFCRSRVAREVDQKITRINCITGGHITAAMSPLDYETDAEIFDVITQSVGLTESQDIRFVWIRNTLDVAEFVCSESYLEQVQSREDLEQISELQELPFDADGNLPDFVTDALNS